MKKILILIISIGLIFGLVGIGTQAYFSDVKTSSVNIFTAGVWEYTINATAGDGGSIDPSGEIPVNKGDNQTFTITPADGYKIADVVVDEVDSVKDVLVEEDGSGTYIFINVTENHTIHAIFAPLTWDKSSLGFTWAGTIDATQVCATVKNGDDSGAMQGEVDWELHYVESGQASGPQNDKEESIIARGKIPALVQGGSYNICWPESGQVGPGIYKFKAYQRPGHPGTGTLWSSEIKIDSVINSATQVTGTVDVVAASVTLSSIAITTSATKLTYTVGDPLDITGLVVTGTYSDGSSAPVTISTSDVSGFNSSAPVTGQVLTITVDGKTATYTVDVVAAPPAPEDTTAPVITLLGEDPVNLYVGETYTDAGATALDNGTVDLTGSIVTTFTPGPVDTSVPGTFTVHYNVSDAAENPAEEVTRTVIVEPADSENSEDSDGPEEPEEE